jgi:PRD1 phage membrane DNA delivery
MDHFWTSLVTIGTGIIGIAIIAVLVSNKAQTSGVITSAGQAFANDLTAAVAPVSGASASVNTGGSGFGGFTGGGGAGYQQGF